MDSGGWIRWIRDEKPGGFRWHQVDSGGFEWIRSLVGGFGSCGGSQNVGMSNPEVDSAATTSSFYNIKRGGKRLHARCRQHVCFGRLWTSLELYQAFLLTRIPVPKLPLGIRQVFRKLSLSDSGM